MSITVHSIFLDGSFIMGSMADSGLVCVFSALTKLWLAFRLIISCQSVC